MVGDPTVSRHTARKGPFTTPQVANLIGIPERKLLTYVERRFVAPSVREAAGHGSKRLWSYDDVVRCAIIKLLSHTLSVSTLRLVGAHLGKSSMSIAPERLVLVIRLDEEMDRVMSMSLSPGSNPFSLLDDPAEDTARCPIHLLVVLRDLLTPLDPRTEMVR